MIQRRPEQPGNNRPRWPAYLMFALLLALVLYAYRQYPPGEPVYEIPYSQFKALVKAHKVAEVLIQGETLEGQLDMPEAIGPKDETAQHFRTRVPPFGDDSLLPLLEKETVKVTVKRELEHRGWAAVLLALMPWLILFLFFLLDVQTHRERPGRAPGRAG